MSTKIVIKDSCMIIDHCELGLLDDFFRLELSVYTTPNVIAEITDPDQAAHIDQYVKSGQLKVDGTGDVSVIASIATENPALSAADSSVLELAMRLKATVLTSDGSLRKVTLGKEITVRGGLWVIEELVEQRIIDPATALEKLKQYPEINPRAPRNEIENLIVTLQNLMTQTQPKKHI